MAVDRRRLTRRVIASVTIDLDDGSMSNNEATATIESAIDHQAIVDDYFAAWNSTDPAVRSATLAAVYATDAHLCDPLADVAGHEQLAALFARFHETYPGCRFRQRGTIDSHHQLLRWGWEMVAADGTVMLDGLDVALVDTDSKISFVAGFFGLALPGS
jgi:hypothetical protein